MGVFTYQADYTSKTPIAKLFKAFILDANNLIPKIAPQAIKTVDILEGNGGPGTIKKIVFGEGPHHLKKIAKLVQGNGGSTTITFVEGCALGYVIYKTDAVDEANYIYKYTMIEGDILGDLIEKISFETKLVEGPDGGSIIKSTTNYYIKGDLQIDESKAEEGKEKTSQLFKHIDTYLKNNPNEYN